VNRRTRPFAAALALPALFAALPAAAQEATNTPAATQPSVGKFYFRQKLQYVRMSDDPSPEDREFTKFISTSSLSYGLARTLAVTLDLPAVLERENSTTHPGGHSDRGLYDLDLSLKWRPFQWDLGPVDSVRVAFTAGVEAPTGTDDFSSHSWDPSVGAVFTAILGRHGFNQSLRYKFNTGGDTFNARPGDGPDDALRFDSAYLFRLSPAEYAADTSASTYLTAELNGLYETSGDTEILLGPGLLYEARTFALELSAGLPVYRDVDERPRTDLVITVGLRLLF
jgi:hypothetical protein